MGSFFGMRYESFRTLQKELGLHLLLIFGNYSEYRNNTAAFISKKKLANPPPGTPIQ